MPETQETKKEKLEELIASSQTAFLNGMYQEAFRLAKAAIRLDEKSADAYQCAANVCMSLDRYEDAIGYYEKARDCDPDNGNRWFNLGYAQATVNQLADAVENFAKGAELGMNPDAAAQMYHILGIVNQQLGKFDDAIHNFRESEKIVPGDMDIMKRKAAVYGMMDDLPNCLNVANQMKLLSPLDYAGYQVAYIALKRAGRLEDAAKELGYAMKSLGSFPFALMKDIVDYYLTSYQKDENQKYLDSALDWVKRYLQDGKPSQQEVTECYINAADMFLQCEKADEALTCLHAAENPSASYLAGIFYRQPAPKPLSRENIFREYQQTVHEYEKLSREQLEMLQRKGIATEVPQDMTKEKTQPETQKKFVIPPEIQDMINRLYVNAGMMKQDYRLVMQYAVALQQSKDESLSLLGFYTEAKAQKALHFEKWEDSYARVQKLCRNAVLKDPSDLNAAVLRVKTLIDIGHFTEAEELCGCLREEIRQSLLEELAEAKQGGQENGISDS